MSWDREEIRQAAWCGVLNRKDTARYAIHKKVRNPKVQSAMTWRRRRRRRRCGKRRIRNEFIHGARLVWRFVVGGRREYEVGESGWREREREVGGINAKLAIHTKSPGFQVKRGEYIKPVELTPLNLPSHFLPFSLLFSLTRFPLYFSLLLRPLPME